MNEVKIAEITDRMAEWCGENEVTKKNVRDIIFALSMDAELRRSFNAQVDEARRTYHE